MRDSSVTWALQRPRPWQIYPGWRTPSTWDSAANKIRQPKNNTWTSLHLKRIASGSVFGSGQGGSLRWIKFSTVNVKLFELVESNSNFKFKLRQHLQAKHSGFGLALVVLTAGLLATAEGSLNLDLAFFLGRWFMSLSKVQQLTT